MLARRLLSPALASSRRALRAKIPRGAIAGGATRSRRLGAAFSTIVHTSPHEDIEIPDVTIWEVMERQAAEQPDKPAFVCGVTHEARTFSELHDGAKRMAVALARDGVRKGDAVVLHSFNCIDYPMVVLALTSLGAVCSPASPMLLPNELALQLAQAKANYLITHHELKGTALEAAATAGVDTRYVYTIGKGSPDDHLQDLNEISAKHSVDDFTYEPLDPQTKAMLPFSSGTTGIPKGVALSARNMLANALQVGTVEKLGPYSLGLVPFYHIYGMMLLHLSIYQGKAIVTLPRFQPETFLSTLSDYRIRTAHIAPPAVLFLAHNPLVNKYDLSATEFVVSGGAPMGEKVETLVRKRLGLHVKQIYGMTELSPAVNYGEDELRKPGSVGRLVPNTELRVRCLVDDVDLPAKKHGELMFRGPQVMLGYVNNEDANKSVFTDDGFLRTGDIGYIDDDGFVYVVDRAKELIKYKGHQVAPAELEDVLNHHPGIADSCCVRGQNAEGEEIPKAYVVRKDNDEGNELTKEQVLEFVAERVAPYKKVRAVEFIDAIPKSPTGKMLRRQLQEIENKHHEG